MGLEDILPDIESSEGNGNSAEAAKASSEKFREQIKKAGAQIKKTRKDEKKAKKYDFLLAGFLVKIIIDKKYDTILDTLFPAIHGGYPSNFILGILSLINIEVSNKIRETSNKELINFNYEIKKEVENFDDNNMNSQIKNRISYWVEDIIDSVVIDYSNIQTKKLKLLLESDNSLLLIYTSNIFNFFLNKININIIKEKSDSISEFILSEIEKSLNKLEIENM